MATLSVLAVSFSPVSHLLSHSRTDVNTNLAGTKARTTDFMPLPSALRISFPFECYINSPVSSAGQQCVWPNLNVHLIAFQFLNLHPFVHILTNADADAGTHAGRSREHWINKLWISCWRCVLWLRKRSLETGIRWNLISGLTGQKPNLCFLCLGTGNFCPLNFPQWHYTSRLFES